MKPKINKRLVASDRNSYCGSARLRDLDWSQWWTDGWIHTGRSGRVIPLLYLHVAGPDGSWHRVGPMRRKGEVEAWVRLEFSKGKLYWLI